MIKVANQLEIERSRKLMQKIRELERKINDLQQAKNHKDLIAPNQTIYRLTVENNGNLVTTEQ